MKGGKTIGILEEKEYEMTMGKKDDCERIYWGEIIKVRTRNKE